MKKYFFFLGIIFFAATSAFAEASARTERILSFQSHVTVLPEGDLLVSETIKVYCAGQEIKRGIYREFPILYVGPFGERKAVELKIQRVLRDGQPDSYHYEQQINGALRIYIGDANVFLVPGEYTYTISYLTTDHLQFLNDRDRLYWNVTGNDWAFEMEEVSAEVFLPQSAAEHLLEQTSFVGIRQSKEQGPPPQIRTDQSLFFSAGRKLAVSEGLSIVVAWPKEFVREPNQQEKIKKLVYDNKGSLIGFGCFLILMFYYLFVWIRLGRDPARGTIIPIYQAPDNLSPAAVRFIMNMGSLDNTNFISAIIHLAVRGYLNIHQTGGKYALEKKDYSEQNQNSYPEESELLSALFQSQQVLDVAPGNHRIIREAVNGFRGAFGYIEEKVYFLRNSKWFWTGVAFSAAALVLSSLLAYRGLPLSAMAAVSIFYYIGMGVLLGILLPWIKDFQTALRTAIRQPIVSFVLLTVFVIVSMLVFSFSRIITIWFFFCTWLLVLPNIIFFYLLKAPTPTGRKVMDQIEGFKMFLSTAEKDRLNWLNPPEKTPELFEKCLPYALALGVEQAWSEQFADVLNNLPEEMMRRRNFMPWYLGHMAGDHFARDFSQSFSSAIASASVDPSSSRGGSGGGGGGGGGGGW